VDGVEMDVRLPVGYEKDEEAFHDNPFSEFLNWATANNPDGVPLVHDAFNQVLYDFHVHRSSFME
jgi:hypothetical protein